MLLVHGTRDRVVPAGASAELGAALPRARVVPVEGAGHDLPRSAAPRVADAFRRFAGERGP